MHLTTTAVTNVERGKNEQTPEAANCFVCSRHYDSFSWHSIYILEFSMTTIDNIMALALNYRLAGSASRDEHEEALRTALTDALAQPVREHSPGACKVCGNEYLASRTDIYKDKRPFIYCDCCGSMADRKTWYLTHGIGGDK